MAIGDWKATVVPRIDWKAILTKEYKLLKIPIQYVTWTDTVTDPCETKEECCETLRFLQKCHMETQGLDDISHNFLIGKDGTIYEGRGWLANTSKRDPRHDVTFGNYITIARIGNDVEGTPATPEELAAKNEIIRYGIEIGYIDKNYKEIEFFRY